MGDQGIALVDHAEDEQNPERQPEPLPPSENAHIDVLYENQRGWFVFGLPLFSSRALWNLKIDQSPWVDSKFKPSPVNITNAQLPDPSWVWEWKSWYVDMSQDVDEEGWQYSFWFRGAAWHGNHPWFHSFVRRRRWLRKRIKRKLPPKTKENRERLFGETFSIGTTLARTVTIGTGFASSQGSNEQSFDEEVKDIPTLMRKLKKAAIDREKIVFINKFIEEGGEELYYLAEQIPAIMAMLIFQNSRRQLLSSLMTTFDDAQAHRESHKEGGEREDTEERRIKNLLKAIEAADAECKKLEYWSDIRRLAEEGSAGNATDTESRWGKEGHGLDGSGAKHPGGTG